VILSYTALIGLCYYVDEIGEIHEQSDGKKYAIKNYIDGSGGNGGNVGDGGKGGNIQIGDRKGGSHGKRHGDRRH
jgi:hypothetical protein